MDENLGTLAWDFRARLDKFYQDCSEADARMSALRQKWSQPFSVGGSGGGGMAGSGGSGHSAAVEAAMQATGVGASPRGAGPVFTGTSNGDVTWNLSRMAAGTQARYGSSGGRGRGGVYDIDDPSFPQTPEEQQRGAQLKSLVAAAAKARAEFGGRGLDSGPYGVLGSSYREKTLGYDLSPGMSYREQYAAKQAAESGGGFMDSLRGAGQSFRGALSQPVAIRTLIRSTVIGLVADAAAGMASAEGTYMQSMTLSGVDSVAKSRATAALSRTLLRSVPFVGGILSNVYDAAGGTATETQNVLTERQLAFQDERFGSLMGRRASIQQRESLAAGPNVLTGRLAMLGAQRTGITSQFQSESTAARAAFNAANPEIADPLHIANTPYGQDIREAIRQRQNRLDTFNQQQNSILAGRLGVNDQEKAEAQRSADFALGGSQAEVARAIRQNEFRPGAADAEFSTATARNLRSYYAGRKDITDTDRAQLASSVELLRQGDIGRQRDIENNFRFGSGYQYAPQVESPLTMTDRAPETQTQVYDAFTQAIAELTTQLAQMNRGGNN